MDQDLELFFKDFGATVEQTVDLAAGVEETCYSVLQKTTAEIPWLDELNSKLQSCVEREDRFVFERRRFVKELRCIPGMLRTISAILRAKFQFFGVGT
jgi:hypothetical protein